MTTERLFFALWPDAATRASLARRMPEWTSGLDGRLQRPDQWHVTLEFIGSVDAERRALLLAVAGSVPMPPFELQFDRVECWSQPQVVCLVAGVTPEPLARFVAQLRAALAATGFEPDPRPWRPHVTIARKVRAAAVAAVTPPLPWPAAEFALVRSITEPAGSRYEPLCWWNATHRNGCETGDSG